MPMPRSLHAARAAFAVLLACLLPCAPASAWGGTGHRLVAALADDELTPTARGEVAKLLAGEPEPTLAGVANWADDLRDADPERGRRTARWHFVNLGEHGCRAVPAACADGACVNAAIVAQAALLADRSRGVAERREALKFVVHFIGDIHQPLHAAFARDRGGNDVQVSIPQRDGSARGSNLHRLWDSDLLRDTGLDEAAHLARLRALPLVIPRDTPVLPPRADAWAEASCAIALRDGLYPPRAKLDPGYAARWMPTVDQQLRIAGSRLAAVLNAALSP